MSIFDNPFYLLGASPRDDRRTLLRLAEEKALEAGAEACEDARAALSGPRRRLCAEIRWFPNCSDDQIDENVAFIKGYVSHIVEPMPDASKLNTLSCLNIWISCSPAVDMTNPSQVNYYVPELSRMYEGIDAEAVRLYINADRAAAGFPAVERTDEVAAELSALRGEIRTMLVQGLDRMPQERYVEVMTRIAERNLSDAPYAGGAVLDDLLSEYALRMAGAVEAQAAKVAEAVGRVEADAESDRAEEDITILSRELSGWSVLVRPLQLHACARGELHPDSREMLQNVRGLSLTLHNRYWKTRLALCLTGAMRQAFGPCPEITELLDKDETVLRGVQNRWEDAVWEAEEAQRRSRMDLVYEVTVHEKNVSIPAYCTCCMQPTKETETVTASKSSALSVWHAFRKVSMPLCPACRAHRKAAERRWWAVLLLTVLCSAAAAWFCIRSPQLQSAAWLVMLLSSLALYLIIGALVRMPALTDDHSTRQRSVWLSGLDRSEETVTFHFTNWRYARRFAAHNGIPLTETQWRNRAAPKSFLMADERPARTLGYAMLAGWFCMLILFVLLSPADFLDLDAAAVPSPAPSTAQPPPRETFLLPDIPLIYRIDELGVTADIPLDLYVFTREVDEQTPGVAELGLDVSAMRENMTANNIYLRAIEQQFDYAIDIAADVSGGEADFADCSAAELDDLAAQIKAQNEDAGFTCGQPERYAGDGATYLRFPMERTDEEGTLYLYEYQTIYRERALWITLYSFTGEISPAQETRLKDIADSVCVSEASGTLPEK